MSVGIRYREQIEADNLAGMTVAEARGLYRDQLDIPDEAQAYLGGRPIKKRLEAETRLVDCDELSFEDRKRNLAPVLLGALALLLVITGGIWFFTTASAIITPSAVYAEFAKIEDVSGGGYAPTWSLVFGRYKGKMPSGDLFKITPETNYTGDLLVKVHLTNVGEMAHRFQFINMKLKLLTAEGGAGSQADKNTETTFQVLSLENGVVTFEVAGTGSPSPFYVYLTDGGYHTLPWGVLTPTISADLWCEVTQAAVIGP